MSFADAREMLEAWRGDDDTVRPQNAIGHKTLTMLMKYIGETSL